MSHDHDQVIDAAFLHSHLNCYFVGPFVRRVSFASQQCRVLDLIEALNAQGIVTAEKTVAIVGAGIAGITAAAALRGLKSKVHLYEADEPFARQCRASHRVVHPTISRWPLEDLQHSTALPFMDWCAGPCDQVIAFMKQEWEQSLRPSPDDEDFVFFGHTEVDWLNTSRADGKIQLRVIGAKDDRCTKTLYDVVIVTTGFGAETASGREHAESYWQPDAIANNSEGLRKWREELGSVVITGCGDGGLIDCLRVVHGDFREGWLTVELAALLGQFKDEISQAERKALRMAKSIKFMPLKPRRRGGKATLADDLDRVRESDDYVKELRDAYVRIVQRLPPDAKELLDNSVASSGVQRGAVILVSREAHPFVPESAPIHKLMIAHAQESGFVQYYRGKCVVENGTAVLYQPNHPRMPFDKASIVIVRHGAPPRMIGDIMEGHVASLQIRQALLADYFDLSKRREIPAPEGYPSRKVLEEEVASLEKSRFIGSRYSMARALIAQIDKGLRLSADAGGYIYERVAPPTNRLGISPPEQVFGVGARPGSVIEGDFL